jgi:DNA (cytosine-5)-methyltransferase 1
MPVKRPIQIVDLFAGPGGLGEGFASFPDKFEILFSAEMEQAAHQTLTLRAFYRELVRNFPEGLRDYYQYCRGSISTPWTDNTVKYWKKAEEEARRIELGTKKGNAELDHIIIYIDVTISVTLI